MSLEEEILAENCIIHFGRKAHFECEIMFEQKQGVE